jgi:8-oxo-dGTP pyrophosphatase MutT (NUDIX family)/geranylgeranyl pyrophosphate synthase
MRDFVGGLLFDERGRLLLVERAGADPDMGGLWSLPAGGIDPGESDRAALVRELSEETGLHVDVCEKVTTVRRSSWRVKVYRALAIGGELDSRADKDIARTGWFAVDELPEDMVLEARIAVVRHMLAGGHDIDAVALTTAIDGLFSALFHSYIRPALAWFAEVEHGDLLSSSVLKTPHRKFKAAIPFLLSDLSEEARLHAVIAEALFGLWTILDDVCDDRPVRYGVPTVFHDLGRGRAVSFVFGAMGWLSQALRKRVGESYSDQVTEALLACAEAQYRRFRGEVRTIDEYLEDAAERARFLGTAWAAGLDAIGRTQEASALRTLQRETAQFGQLLNDYFDLTRPDGLRDVQAGIRNAYVIWLEEVASAADRKRLGELWEAADRAAVSCEFRRLAAHYSLAERIRQDLHRRLQELIEWVRRSPFGEPQRAVLTGWLELSLKDTLPVSAVFSGKENLQRFVSGFEEICRLIP